jgi:hypothetical protein
MGAITATLPSPGSTEFSGDYKVLKITCVPASASDTLTLTLATHGISEILFTIPKLTAGYDAALAGAFTTHSGLVITLVTTASAGTAATDWTGATAEILVIGRSGT